MGTRSAQCFGSGRLHEEAKEPGTESRSQFKSEADLQIP